MNSSLFYRTDWAGMMTDYGACSGAYVGEGAGRGTAELHFAGHVAGGSLRGGLVRPRHARDASGGDVVRDAKGR